MADFKELPKNQPPQIVKGRRWVEQHGGGKLRNSILTDDDKDNSMSFATNNKIVETFVHSSEMVVSAREHWRAIPEALK